MLEVGVKAPDFELPDQNGKIHRLSDYTGKKVILYFYPKDNTCLLYTSMLESFPGQYPGITKMVRKEQGNQEKADHYRKELLSMMRPVTGE